ADPGAVPLPSESAAHALEPPAAPAFPGRSSPAGGSGVGGVPAAPAAAAARPDAPASPGKGSLSPGAAGHAAKPLGSRPTLPSSQGIPPIESGRGHSATPSPALAGKPKFRPASAGSLLPGAQTTTSTPPAVTLPPRGASPVAVLLPGASLSPLGPGKPGGQTSPKVLDFSGGNLLKAGPDLDLLAPFPRSQPTADAD